MFVVTGRNTALAVFASMSLAVASVQESCPDAFMVRLSSGYAEFRVGKDVLSVQALVQDEPFKSVCPLFRDA